MIRRLLRRSDVLAVALAAMLLGSVMGSVVPAEAAAPPPGSATVIGTVVDQRNALPISGATVTLFQGVNIIASGTTDQYGTFSIPNVPAGVYDISILAKGYAPSSNLNVAVSSAGIVTVNAALQISANSSNLHSLGTVTVTAGALASATTITQSVSVQNLAQTGQIRFVDQLNTLPGINKQTSSSPGDDVALNMRGFGPSETATLIDGRPAGPLGVLAPQHFNFANSTITALDGVDVTYGSGAQGLYGSDTIAGAVNMHLLSPTLTPHYIFQQQVGGDGVLSTSLGTTGTQGRFGYVAAAGVSGLTGTLNGDIFQSARPALLVTGSVNPNFACSNANGNDVSNCNQGAETYAVGQESKLTTELGRFRYSMTPTTAVTVSAYSTVQAANSTGNGDNDFLPYATRLAQVQSQTPDCIIGSGSTDNGYTVVTNPITNTTACYTAKQWAAVSWGPDGGGAGRNRSASMRDYDINFTAKEGVNNISLDGYVNNYFFEKDSSLSGGIDASGNKLGTPDFTDYFDTHGYLLSDDLVSENNDLGFGYALINQLQWGQALVAPGSMSSGEPIFAYAPDFTTATYRTSSFFVRDQHEFNDRFSGFLNAWIKNDNASNKTSFDPRLTAQFRPDSNDVLRLTYGHSVGAPAPELKSTGIVFEPDPGSSLTHVSCLLNSLPNPGGNPNLIPETSNDVEIGFGHRFADDSTFEVNAYETSVHQFLFGATEPLLQYGLQNVQFASTTLQTYLARLIAQGCLPPGSQPSATYPFLGIDDTFNAADELARGVDINGRYRFAKKAYLDYGYSVESSQDANFPNAILINNLTLLNGGQQNGIPLHQGTASLDFQPGTFELRIDNYYIGNNNPLDRPAYWFTNAFLSHPLNGGAEIVTLGGTNIFNSAVQEYGFIGSGEPQAVNPFAPPSANNGLAQNIAGIASNEEFGLQPANVTLTLTVRI
ncbi:MAG TPA: TonB-dependent receptor [Candidatus Eremiobacteraceae bacterium]|nr:TonB-dependent receptor [Candidatus Eremiobacteraceae bacterium]